MITKWQPHFRHAFILETQGAQDSSYSSIAWLVEIYRKPCVFSLFLHSKTLCFLPCSHQNQRPRQQGSPRRRQFLGRSVDLSKSGNFTGELAVVMDPCADESSICGCVMITIVHINLST